MFTRETIKFLIPTSMLSLTTNSTSDREIIPLYINPQNITINYSKNIGETQTIGGFIIQYWGDKITKMTIGGTTGSGGIEAINILHNIYRSEQTQFKKLLLKRQRDLAANIQTEQAAAQNASAGTSLSALDQVLFNGAFTDIANGVSETMDFFLDAIAGNEVGTSTGTVRLLPTLSAFAVSLDMHYQGKVHRGYIESMNVTESANSPGHFDYTIQYSSLREFGERKNFMPWHTNPRDSTGRPKQLPTGSGNKDNLSVPFTSAKESTSSTAKSILRVTDDQRGTSIETGDPNSLSRFNKIR